MNPTERHRMLAAMALTAHAERSDHWHAVYLSDQLFKGMRQDSEHVDETSITVAGVWRSSPAKLKRPARK